jgi:hypothetical protein
MKSPWRWWIERKLVIRRAEKALQDQLVITRGNVARHRRALASVRAAAEPHHGGAK